MSETFDDQYIRPRDMADRQFVAWVREDINNLSPKMISYSQRCELFETVLALCERLEKSTSESEKKTKEIQEINRVLMDESAQWRSRELWKSSCEAKDEQIAFLLRTSVDFGARVEARQLEMIEEIESLRKIAEAARDYREAQKSLDCLDGYALYQADVKRQKAMRKLDGLFVGEDRT